MLPGSVADMMTVAPGETSMRSVHAVSCSSTMQTPIWWSSQSVLTYVHAFHGAMPLPLNQMVMSSSQTHNLRPASNAIVPDMSQQKSLAPSSY